MRTIGVHNQIRIYATGTSDLQLGECSLNINVTVIMWQSHASQWNIIDSIIQPSMKKPEGTHRQCDEDDRMKLLPKSKHM